MFTGIIESVGTVKEIFTLGNNKTFWIESSISTNLKVDQSVSHNGVCLTVEDLKGNCHKVTAVNETLIKSNFEYYKVGDMINLERAMILNSRIDGHIVQGHVEATGICLETTAVNGGWEMRVSYPEAFAHLIIEKGSICLNGVSLTVYNVTQNEFTVSIIPYTYNHTNLKNLSSLAIVNLEFDIIGKYIARNIAIDKIRTSY